MLPEKNCYAFHSTFICRHGVGRKNVDNCHGIYPQPERNKKLKISCQTPFKGTQHNYFFTYLT
jgi:hypothetical protein